MRVFLSFLAIAMSAALPFADASQLRTTIRQQHNMVSQAHNHEHAHANQLPVRHFRRGYTPSNARNPYQAQRASYSVRTRTNTNVIGWQNSSYVQNPAQYQRGVTVTDLSARERAEKLARQNGSLSNLRQANINPGDSYVINNGHRIARTQWTGESDVSAVKAYWQKYDEERSQLIGRPVTTIRTNDTTDYSAHYGAYDVQQGRFIAPGRKIVIY